MNVRLLLPGLLLSAAALLAGCSTTSQPTAVPDASDSARVDQSAPVTGGALFNGN